MYGKVFEHCEDTLKACWMDEMAFAWRGARCKMMLWGMKVDGDGKTYLRLSLHAVPGLGHDLEVTLGEGTLHLGSGRCHAADGEGDVADD